MSALLQEWTQLTAAASQNVQHLALSIQSTVNGATVQELNELETKLCKVGWHDRDGTQATHALHS